MFISRLNTMLTNTARQSQDEENGIANVRLGIQKKGIPCMTYFDVDANGYRTATGQYEVLNAR